MRTLRNSSLILIELLFVGCATHPGYTPLYPSDWPAIVRASKLEEPPDLSGTYRAVSEPASPFVYSSDPSFRPWGAGDPLRTPYEPQPVGRRLLPAFFCGTGVAMKRERSEVYYFLAELEPDADHPDGREDRGWVRLTRKPATHSYRVEFGVDGLPPHAFEFDPMQTAKGFWAHFDSHTSAALADGGLGTWATYSLSMLEGLGWAAAELTMYRAADGSLVVLEDAFWANSSQGLFQKWWRWTRIEAAP